MPIASGTLPGRYEIRSKIGEGGSGEVCLVLDTEVGSKGRGQDSGGLARCQQRLQRFGVPAFSGVTKKGRLSPVG